MNIISQKPDPQVPPPDHSPQSWGGWEPAPDKVLSCGTAAITCFSDSYENQTEDIASGSTECTNWVGVNLLLPAGTIWITCFKSSSIPETDTLLA